MMKKLSLIQWSWPLRIFLLALGLRLVYLWALKHFYFFYDHPSSDVTYYQRWAEEILIGAKAPNVYYGLPFYPYLLAFLKLFTLGNVLALRFFHLVIGSVNCVLTYFVARKIFEERVAKLSALLCAANFILIHYDGLMMPVTFIITLSLSIILLYEYLEHRKKKREWFILGILIGLGALGDGKFILLTAFLIFYLLKTFKKELTLIKPRVVYPLILGVFMVLFVTTLRNRVIGGDWVLVSAQEGLSFYVGNNPKATGTFENPDFIRPTHEGQDMDQRIMAEQTLKRSFLKPSQVSAFWRNQALQFIWNSPRQYLTLLKNKFLAFWSDDEAAYDLDLLFQRNWKHLLDINPYILIAPLGLIGIIFTRRENKKTALPFYFILSQLVFTLIFFLTHRHRTTILPLLIIFESTTLFWLWENIKSKNYKNLMIVLASCVVMLIVFWPRALQSQSIDFLKFSKTAAILEKEGKLKEAREHYRSALKIYPQDPNLWVNLANTYAKEENYSQALKYYLRALTLAPYHVDALYNLAFSYEKLEDFKAAIPLYTQVIQLDPSSHDAHFRLGLVYQSLNQCSQANQHLAEVIRLMPSLKNHISKFFKDCPTHH